MKLILTPQRSDIKFSYNLEGDIISVTHDDISDTFDFSGLPDGIVSNIETILPINPVISAVKENGVLTVKMLAFYPADSEHSELKERVING